MSAPCTTPTVARVLAFIAAHDGTTSGPIADALGLATRDVSRRLADAMKRGSVTRTGAGPSGYAYSVTDLGRTLAEGAVVPAAIASAAAAALPDRAAELVRAENFSPTAEIAADLGVDVDRARQALRTAERRGLIVGDTVEHRGQKVTVWRAVGIARVSA